MCPTPGPRLSVEISMSARMALPGASEPNLFAFSSSMMLTSGEQEHLRSYEGRLAAMDGD